MTQDVRRKEIQILCEQYKCDKIDGETFFDRMLVYEQCFVLPSKNITIMNELQALAIDDGLDEVFPDALRRAIEELTIKPSVSLFNSVAKMHGFALNDYVNKRISYLYSEYNNGRFSKKRLLDYLARYMMAEKKGFQYSAKSNSVICFLKSLGFEEDIEACYDDTVVKCVEKYIPESGVPFLAYFRERYHNALCDLKDKVFSEGKPTITVREPDDVAIYEQASLDANVIGMLPAGSFRRVYAIRNAPEGLSQFYQIYIEDKRKGYVLADDSKILFFNKDSATKEMERSIRKEPKCSGQTLEDTMLAVYCTAFRKQNKTKSQPGVLSKRLLEQQFSTEVILYTLHTDGDLASSTCRHEQLMMTTIDHTWLQYLLSAPCKSFRDIILTPRNSRNHFSLIANDMAANYRDTLLNEDLQEKNIREEMISYDNYSEKYCGDDTEVKLCWCEIAVRLPYLRKELKIDRPFRSLKSYISNLKDDYEKILGVSLQLGDEERRNKMLELQKAQSLKGVVEK